jgi:hypothetical protein
VLSARIASAVASEFSARAPWPDPKKVDMT